MTPDHGTRTRYLRGCKCDACREANRRGNKAWRMRVGYSATVRHVADRPRLVDSAATLATLDAMRARGLSWRAMGRELDVKWTTVAELGRRRPPRVRVATAAAFAEWQPVADDAPDEVVVQRLIDGADWRALGATRAERIAAAARAWATWAPARRAAKAQGTSDQDLPGESLTSLEDRLGLRAGRDFERVTA